MPRLTINLLTTASPSNVLTTVPGAAITVFARNPDGTEGGVATVYQFADPTNLTPYPGALVSDAQGRIPGWLDPGDYVIAVSATGYAPYSTAYSVPRTLITQDPSGANMPLETHIQFAGVDVTVGDDPTNTRTVITPGGGTSPGAATVRQFPFAFDTPGLSTGAALYTPTIGDILLDGWISVDTAWNGTTPTGDFGTFQGGGTVGWIQYLFNNISVSGIDMTLARRDLEGGFGGLSVQQQATWLSFANMLSTVDLGLVLNAIPPTTTRLAYGASATAKPPTPHVQNTGPPALFTAANPIKALVSQDGTTIGGSPVATQGTATLYLVTATPA